MFREGLFKIDEEAEKAAKRYSIIHWQTGKPVEEGYYLTTMDCGDVHVNFWKILPNCAYWLQCNPNRVVAWCKLSDIDPYKEETK